MTWSMMVPHGSEVTVDRANGVLIRRPGVPAVRIKPRDPFRCVVIGPALTLGNRLEFRA